MVALAGAFAFLLALIATLVYEAAHYAIFS